jgi:TonB-dependent starch-binding outer membrane protein SusC
MKSRSHTKTHPRTGWLAAIAVAVALIGIPGLAAAQAGVVAGQVISDRTGDPLANAQVVIVGTNIGTLTDQDGQFRLGNVQAGDREIRAQRIGYRTVTQSIAVRAGETTNVALRLGRSAVELDEVIVTGQGGATARREIGTTIATIDARALEVAPISNVSQMLQSRAPGITVMSGGGQVGQGSRILLRGATSASQSIEPVIYVDGVRITNEAGTGVSSDAGTSGLDDINPADIERIEVIRGAAAATMYGTEASGGVIQIFTRQGAEGAQVWNARTEYGILHTTRDMWDVGVYSDWFYDRLVNTGHQHSQHLGVRGTMDRFSYNASGTFRQASGVLDNDNADYRAFRANMRFTPTDDFSLNINTGYTWRLVQFAENGNNSYNIISNAMQGGPRGHNWPPEELHTREDFQNSGRFTAGVGLTWSPLAFFSNRLQFGTDIVNWDNRRHRPFGDERYPIGHIYNYRRESLTVNVDYTGTVELPLSSAIDSRTSFGFQGYDRARSSNHARGWRLAGPNVRVVTAAVNRGSSEWRQWDKQAGVFGEQQFGINDLFYFTVGARMDGHSAFGAEAGWATYPKVDASWNVSDHGFWPDGIGTLRLRAAYGTAGQQPGEFDAARTWQSVAAFDSEPAITTRNVGNPDLAPEVSHEIETGFDASILQDRVGLEVTHYNQRTADLLFNVRNPPSQGVVGTQLMNVGEIRNRGIEIGMNAAVIESPRFRWDANVNFSTNNNEVISLGGGAPLQVHWMQWVREGYPVGAFFDDRWIEVDGEVGLASELLADADGNLPEGWDYIGPAFPTRNFNFGSTFGLGRSISASFLIDHKGGHFIESATTRWMSDRLVQAGEPLFIDEATTPQFAPDTPIANWCHAPTDPIVQKMCEEPWSVARGNHAHPADNWRLREVSLAYRFPRELAGRFGASSATFSVAGRNLWRQQDYIGLEVEASYISERQLSNQAYFDTPHPREFVAQFNVNF